MPVISLDIARKIARTFARHFARTKTVIRRISFALLLHNTVCKIAQAIGVEIQEDNIEISHRIGRKRGDKAVLAKFVSHKVKWEIYKARTNLKAVSVQSLFPDSSVSSV